MDLDTEEVLKESLLNGFITVFNMHIPIGEIDVPLWTMLVGPLLLMVLFKRIGKTRL